MKKPDSSKTDSTGAIHKMNSRLGDITRLNNLIDTLNSNTSTLRETIISIDQHLAALDLATNLLPHIHSSTSSSSETLASLNLTVLSVETNTKSAQAAFYSDLTLKIDSLMDTRTKEADLLIASLNKKHDEVKQRLIDTANERLSSLQAAFNTTLEARDKQLHLTLAKSSQDIIDANYRWHRIYFSIIAFIALLLLLHLALYVPFPFSHSPQTDKTLLNQPLNQSSDSPSPSVSDDQHKPASSTEEPKKNPSHNSKKQ